MARGRRRQQVTPWQLKAPPPPPPLLRRLLHRLGRRFVHRAAPRALLLCGPLLIRRRRRRPRLHTRSRAAHTGLQPPRDPICQGTLPSAAARRRGKVYARLATI
jgi:hypothetical protein